MQYVIARAGGSISICGKTISDVDINGSHSAIEAMCVAPCGDQRAQLARQLTVAALNLHSGSTATFSQFDSCNAICANSHSTAYQLSDCESKADGFNNSGDCQNDCFPTHPPVDTLPCDMAGDTTCTLLDPTSCTH